jgi:hypothetical protein
MSIDACVEWAMAMVPKMRPINGTGVGDMLKNLQPVPDYISQRRKEILAPFPNAKIEPILRDYLAVFRKGEHSNRHTDQTRDGYTQYRLNWFLSVPDSGGELWVGTSRIHVEKNGVYMVNPSVPHHISVVTSDIPCVVVSFGILVPEGF